MFMIPYCIQLCCFTFWSNFLIKSNFIEEYPDYAILQAVVPHILFVTSIWFTIFEINQLINQRFIGYFFNAWNYVESLPLIFIFTNLGRNSYGTKD
jgi:hypothetical protein